MNGALAWPFMRLYLLTLLYFSANAVLNVIIPLQGAAWDASSSTVGLIMGAYMLTTMFFRPWAGRIIQRHGAVKILRLILLLNGAALILYTFTGIGGYIAARSLQGVCTAFFSMALQIGIIEALPDNERSQGISMYSLFSYIPGIVVPFLALALWQTGGMPSFSVILIVIAVATAIFGYTIRSDQQEHPDKNSKAFGGEMVQRSMWGMFAQLVKQPALRTCGMLMLSASVVFGAVTAFMPLYAQEVDGANAGGYLGIQAAVVVAARLFWGKKLPSGERWSAPLIMGMMTLISLSALSISYAAGGGAAFLYLGAVPMGIAQAILYPALTTHLSFVLPAEDRNVLLGLFIATADLGISLGGMVMGMVADAANYAQMFIVCAVLDLVMLPVAYRR